MWACGMLYKVILQMVILNRSGNWVVTGAMLKVLEGFHPRAAWRIIGMEAMHTEDREWYYSLVYDLMKASRLGSIKEYIQRQKATIAAQVAFRSIYEMCIRD